MFGITPYNNKNSLQNRRGSIADFHNAIDDFFNDTFVFGDMQNIKIDLRETDNEYIIEAEIPGFKKEDVKINAEDDYINISVNHEEKSEEKKGSYLQRERRVSSMQRSVYLPGVKNDGITAKYTDGVLEITAQKDAGKTGSKQISIE
ncbi:MAG: Hsp20/alpha crystallin family protein [Clostridiales bacterium]|jgi:HSP20 family protein|nr:Hsp20/alpha crystallin family protein [Clostridiales bacterium]